MLQTVPPITVPESKTREQSCLTGGAPVPAGPWSHCPAPSHIMGWAVPPALHCQASQLPQIELWQNSVLRKPQQSLSREHRQQTGGVHVHCLHWVPRRWGHGYLHLDFKQDQHPEAERDPGRKYPAWRGQGCTKP